MFEFPIIEQILTGIFKLTGYPLIPKVGVGGAIEALEKVDAGQVITYSLVFLFMMAFLVAVGVAMTVRKFGIKMDPIVEKVREVLPGANCGACGFAGCMSYAEAVAAKPDVPPNLCPPGKEAVAEAIANLTGKKAEKREPKIARIFCQGDDRKANRRFLYHGIEDCTAAIIADGGDKSCIYACLGYGTCERACPFKAIKMSPDNLPIVDPELCTSCGVCVQACPKKLIEIVPVAKAVFVSCSSKDKGPIVRKNCSVGCIACGMCVKTCPFEAITLTDNLARINVEKCRVCGLCVSKCPTKAICDYIPERTKAVIIEGCNGCTNCAKICPVNAASGVLKSPHKIDPSKCIGCGICVPRCPVKVIVGTFNATATGKESKDKEPVISV